MLNREGSGWSDGKDASAFFKSYISFIIHLFKANEKEESSLQPMPDAAEQHR